MNYRLLLGACLAVLFNANVLAAADQLPGTKVDALIAQGQALANKGLFADALAKYELAIKADSASAEAYLRKGGMQVALQGYGDSVETFQTAITLDPDNGPAFIGMAVALIHMGRYNMAQAALQEAGQRSPEKREDIDKVLSWLDKKTAREKGPAAVH